MDKKSISHTAWKCQYHLVFIPKYRKKKLYGQVRADVRDIIKTLCSYCISPLYWIQLIV